MAPPFVDYLTLMLVNMSAGLAVTAFYILHGMSGDSPRSWAPAFAAPGLVALIGGLHMSLTWPITKFGESPVYFANAAFGEMSVLLGAAFLAAALAIAMDWTLKPLSVYTFMIGVIAIVVGCRIGNLGLTQAPGLTTTGFILSGLGGVLLGPTLCIKRPIFQRLILCLILLAAAAIWLVTAVGAYWVHLAMWSGKAGA